MSMTSKVNPGLRAQILYLLKNGILRSNKNLESSASNFFGVKASLRTIQEATQKMKAQGDITSTRFMGTTFYGNPRVLQLKAPIGNGIAYGIEQKLLTSTASV